MHRNTTNATGDNHRKRYTPQTSKVWHLLLFEAFIPMRSLRTVWPSGLRRWLKAPVRKGVGSNPTAVNAFAFKPRYVDSYLSSPCLLFTGELLPFPRRCKQQCGNKIWTHWDLNPGPSACEADVIPLHHVPLADSATQHHWNMNCAFATRQARAWPQICTWTDRCLWSFACVCGGVF